MPGAQHAEARRQQPRCCLDHENVTEEVWSRAISELLADGKWSVSIDRTECLHDLMKWHRGTTINLLFLPVVTHSSAVTLLRGVLPSGGASDTAEQIELPTRFVTQFGRDRLQFLTADCEFIERDWLGWLVEQQ